MTKIDSIHYYTLMDQHRVLLESIRTKYLDEGNRTEVIKAVKKSNEARCRSAGKGDHVDVLV